MGIAKNVSNALGVIAVLAAIASYFMISAGVICAAVVVCGTGFLFFDRSENHRSLNQKVVGIGFVGVVLAAIGTIGLMHDVRAHCGAFEPHSEAGITCFNENYSSSWGLHHLLSK